MTRLLPLLLCAFCAWSQTEEMAVTFSWPNVGPCRFTLDGVTTNLTTNRITVTNLSAPWPKVATVTAGTNYMRLRFGVEYLTRWSGTLNESANPRGPFKASGLKVGQVVTGPTRYFSPVLSRQWEIVSWSAGPWTGPLYGGKP